MDSSTCSTGNQSAPTSNIQRKFYQWVLRWINGMQQTNVESNDDSKQNSQSRLDVPILASFFQAIGFKLLSLCSENDDKRKDETSSSTSQPGVLKVTIECGTSKMKAILNLGDVTCRCPNSEHVNDASFWSISGTAPLGSTDNIARNVEETGSNLLPSLPKDVTRVLRDVSQKLFEMISREPDMNHNTDAGLNISRSSSASNDSKFTQGNMRKEIGVWRSYTQPEICLRNSRYSMREEVNASSASSKKPVLQRQRTWDIDADTTSVNEEPRPSPPKITSSPTVPDELSQSLGQLSIAEGNYSSSLTEYIMGAKINLDKALIMLAEKSGTSVSVSVNQDDCASVKSAPTKTSTAEILSPRQTRSNSISVVKPASTPYRFTKEREASVKPTPKNSLQLSRIQRTSLLTSRTPRSSNSVALSLTKKSTQNEQENVKPPLRRRSFYIPSTSSSLSLPSKPVDIVQKLPNDGKHNVTKPAVTPESKLSNKSRTMIKTSGRLSLIKPPGSISKGIPVMVKPAQSSKLSPGIANNSRHSPSIE